ncbi:MAG TPA: hypothetical protein PKV44_04975 [Bacillota bacterium]|nr:hypothetical protein [Bacillota bacterium]HPE38552.1 hypothetical protein [Bacillota bacterium]
MLNSYLLDFSVTSSSPLWQQGLVVCAFGLLGVFSVLFLFFITIFLIQKLSPSGEKKEN